MDKQRVIFIGLVGSGKSTLCNCLTLNRKTFYKIVNHSITAINGDERSLWQRIRGYPVNPYNIFAVNNEARHCTSDTLVSNTNQSANFIVYDTPGFADTDYAHDAKASSAVAELHKITFDHVCIVINHLQCASELIENNEDPSLETIRTLLTVLINKHNHDKIRIVLTHASDSDVSNLQKNAYMDMFDVFISGTLKRYRERANIDKVPLIALKQTKNALYSRNVVLTNCTNITDRLSTFLLYGCQEYYPPVPP